MTEGEKCCERKEGACTSGKGFRCPLTGFHFFFNKQLIRGAILLIVWTNVFAWVWHGNVMSSMYIETRFLWRPQNEMIISALNCGLSLIAFIAAYIFMKGYEGGGWREGVRFGILISLLFFGAGLITFATQPVSFTLIGMWALGDFISYSIGGILLTYVFAGKRDCGAAC